MLASVAAIAQVATMASERGQEQVSLWVLGLLVGYCHLMKDHQALQVVLRESE